VWSSEKSETHDAVDALHAQKSFINGFEIREAKTFQKFSANFPPLRQ